MISAYPRSISMPWCYQSGTKYYYIRGWLFISSTIVTSHNDHRTEPAKISVSITKWSIRMPAIRIERDTRWSKQRHEPPHEQFQVCVCPFLSHPLEYAIFLLFRTFYVHWMRLLRSIRQKKEVGRFASFEALALAVRYNLDSLCLAYILCCLASKKQDVGFYILSIAKQEIDFCASPAPSISAHLIASHIEMDRHWYLEEDPSIKIRRGRVWEAMYSVPFSWLSVSCAW